MPGAAGQTAGPSLQQPGRAPPWPDAPVGSWSPLSLCAASVERGELVERPGGAGFGGRLEADSSPSASSARFAADPLSDGAARFRAAQGMPPVSAVQPGGPWPPGMAGGAVPGRLPVSGVRRPPNSLAARQRQPLDAYWEPPNREETDSCLVRNGGKSRFSCDAEGLCDEPKESQQVHVDYHYALYQDPHPVSDPFVYVESDGEGSGYIKTGNQGSIQSGPRGRIGSF